MPYVHPDDYADTFHNATAEQEREADVSAKLWEHAVAWHELSCCDDIPLGGSLAEGISALQRDREWLRETLKRLPQYLAERAAWLKYEADNGGDRAALGAQERECRYLIKALTNGRYREDGRPSWLVSRIKVPALEQSIAAINGEKGI